MISIIVPCYNEEKVLPIFFKEVDHICSEMSKYEFEFIFIDDGSTDGTLTWLRNLTKEDKRAHYISFSRNFGKEAAIYAGLQAAKGEFVALMDADLQDPPLFLKEMAEQLESGNYECVAMRRVNRKGEPVIRSFFAHLFYKLINRTTQVIIVDGARDFRMMTRPMVEAILTMTEYNRFSKGIFSWVGFHTKWLEYENVERAAGETKWSFWKLFKYSLDGIMGFTTAPLAIASITGIVIFLISLVFIVFIVIRTLIYGDPVAGWPALACIVLFTGGIQLFCTGISSQYLAKTYLEVKKRPIYLTQETDDSNRSRQ